MYMAAGREFHTYFAPVQMEEFEKNNYSLLSLNIGYISNTLKVLLDIFQVSHSGSDLPGIMEEMEIDLPWMRLSQQAGIYNLNSDAGGPINMFHHMSLLFSPNIWRWRTARYQPFIGVESFYIQHSGKSTIDPTKIPIFQNPITGTSTNYSNLINMEFGVLVNRFKVAYRFVAFNNLGKQVQNSSLTDHIMPISQLVVVWQFWN